MSDVAPRPRAPAADVPWAGLSALAGTVAALLLVTAGGYGYHRDELYFLRAGRELAAGYVDQPPLTPLLARIASEVFGDSLVGLRLAPALLAAAVVVVTGLIARELGGDRSAQVFAAACMAVSAFLFAVGHLMSTSTLDLLAWTVLSWAVVRALRRGGASWVWVGLAAAVGLQNKVLPAFLLGALAAGVLLLGPRSVLRSPWPWLAAAVAVLGWSPYLLWQAAHGWPQLELSRAIAAGSSGSSEPRILFLPYQLVLVSPVLVPVWVVGWWRLATDGRLRALRAVAAAYLLLLVLFLATGGKPYYLAGLYPVLLAAGAPPAVDWIRRAPGRLRSTAVAMAVSAAVSVVLFLPVVPAAHLASTPIVDVNYDAGEQVGWPRFARQVAEVYVGLAPAERGRTVVLTRNYGEAGAIDRSRADLALPAAFSGHNNYGLWGPPPERATTTILVGYGRDEARRWFGSVRPAGRVDNGVGLDNDEQGVPIWLCRDRLAPWSRLWPQVRHLG